MSYVPFNQLPTNARLWIFPLDRELSDAESLQMLSEVKSFLHQWTAHNESLTASCDLRYGRFLMVATDEAVAKASGCSIDELYRRIRALGESFDLNVADHIRVQFRDKAGNIRTATRQEFADLAKQGLISPSTTVFNNSITSVEALQADQWELPAAKSWHASMLT